MRARLVVLVSLAAVLAGCGMDGVADPPAEPERRYTLVRLADPPRTEVLDHLGEWIATFTDDAYTVTYRGPYTRLFTEADDTARHDTWVRTLSQPFSGQVDTLWLDQARQDRTPDLLAVAMQYIEGAPPVYDDELQVGGEAGYGPDGQMGSDFHDYLGITWTYPSGAIREPRPDRLGTMDCSGYTRMVFGYRGTPDRVLLSISVSDGSTLPRTSYNQYRWGTGVIVIPNQEAAVPVAALARLQPGDLLFWQTSSRDTPGGITHVGIFLGRDTRGAHRFIHSARSTDGPAFGRTGSTDDFVLDAGYWRTAFRAARRL